MICTMRHPAPVAVLLLRGPLLLVLAACGAEAPDDGSAGAGVTAGAVADAHAAPAELVVLDRSYGDFVEDFNAAEGSVRIVTILPPT